MSRSCRCYLKDAVSDKSDKYGPKGNWDREGVQYNKNFTDESSKAKKKFTKYGKAEKREIFAKYTVTPFFFKDIVGMPWSQR